jgi:ABC-type multidrug transport system fused ATPase/permease subunit
MDPITIALGLAQFVPKIVQWIGGDKAGAVAQKVISVAQQVTGKPSGDQALDALKADPSLVLQFQQAMLAQETTFNQLAVQNAADVNKSLQVEAAAEHWPTYSWRPAIGFATALTLTLVAIVILIAYGGVILANKNPAALAYIPGMIGAVAALLGAGAMPVLGIASWYRGRMQADPTIPTINKG